MNALAEIRHPDDLPIPDEVRIGKGWSEQMIEMADHIGAYAVLRIVEQFGGQYLYVAADPARNVLRIVIGDEMAAIMSHVFGKERLHIPTGKTALAVARRQGVIAMIRANQLSVTGAAKILRTSSKYLSHLVNATEEGTSAGPDVRRRDERQLDMFGE